MKKIAAKERMLNTLMNNIGSKAFSVKTARNKFGIKNVAARIYELRMEGFNIETKTKVKKNGKVDTYYSLNKNIVF